MRDTHREAETQAEGKAGSMQEPDVGLYPRILGSRPEPKADAQPLSHPGALFFFLGGGFKKDFIYLFERESTSNGERQSESEKQTPP